MSNTQLATVSPLSADKIELVKRTIARGASDDELALFVNQCNRTGLDPFSGQIRAVKRWNAASRSEEMAIQVGIDGLRLIADRTGRYDGSEVVWCGPDGIWREAWLSDEPPAAAMCRVYKNGLSRPVGAVAHWAEYAQYRKDGALNTFWQRMPALMLAKCAEALALRKCFPLELSGLYTGDEIPEYTGEPAPAVKIVDAPQLPTFDRKAAVERIRNLGTQLYGDEWPSVAKRMATNGGFAWQSAGQADLEAVIDALEALVETGDADAEVEATAQS